MMYDLYYLFQNFAVQNAGTGPFKVTIERHRVKNFQDVANGRIAHKNNSTFNANHIW